MRITPAATQAVRMRRPVGRMRYIERAPRPRRGGFTNRPRDSGPLPTLDLESADLGEEGRVAQAQLAGGAGLVPARAIQRLGDHAALQLGDVRAQRLPV